MKCDQAGTWLLMSDTPQTPPPTVARHVQDCASCRETQRRLIQLEAEIATLRLPAESNAAKQRFLSTIDQLPSAKNAVAIRSRPSVRPRPRPLHRNRVAFFGAAAALVLAFLFGWAMSSRQNHPGGNQHVVEQHGTVTGDRPDKNKAQSGESPLSSDSVEGLKMNRDKNKTRSGESPQPRVARNELALLQPLIENHIRLAAAVAPEDRFAAVSELSDVLWKEVLRQVETEPAPNLVLLDQMYDKVVSRSLPSRSHWLERDVAATRHRTAETLAARHAKAQQLAQGAVPAVGEILQHVGERSDQAARWITSGELPSHLVATDPVDASHNLLEVVVDRSIRLAEEDDPLRRAGESNDIADYLSRTIVFTSLRGDADASEELGSYLGDVVDRGVMVNLSRFEPSGADETRLLEYERIKQRSQRSTEVLERNLARAPEPARKGLQRALEAKQRGRGKGPPHRKGGDANFIPPGLQK